MDSAVQGNDFELIPTIRVERGHSVEGPFSRKFHRTISSGSYGLLESEVVEEVAKKRTFWKKRPLAEKF